MCNEVGMKWGGQSRIVVPCVVCRSAEPPHCNHPQITQGIITHNGYTISVPTLGIEQYAPNSLLQVWNSVRRDLAASWSCVCEKIIFSIWRLQPHWRERDVSLCIRLSVFSLCICMASTYLPTFCLRCAIRETNERPSVAFFSAWCFIIVGLVTSTVKSESLGNDVGS